MTNNLDMLHTIANITATITPVPTLLPSNKQYFIILNIINMNS